jgi:hypothetical protein
MLSKPMLCFAKVFQELDLVLDGGSRLALRLTRSLDNAEITKFRIDVKPELGRGVYVCRHRAYQSIAETRCTMFPQFEYDVTDPDWS